MKLGVYLHRILAILKTKNATSKALLCNIQLIMRRIKHKLYQSVLEEHGFLQLLDSLEPLIPVDNRTY